ncbi:MAG TPA: HAD family phosphatase [Candidatus Limnocylindria bacterium]|nr:HAD family phosphatase [Candidatus Limnocylindria bacterium]
MSNRLPRPRALIFDLDGTLVDTVETRIRAWLALFDEAAIPADRSEVAALIGADGKRLARAVAAAAGIELDDRRAEELDRRSGEIYETLNTDPRPLPGAVRLLGELDERGLPWAIATSSRRQQVGASVDSLKLSHQPTIVDGSHVEHAKPAPDLLLEAAATLSLPAAACWYVGDATWDMRAAVAAGMPAVGVTSGAVDADALADAGADRVVGSLDEVIALLDG